MVQTPKPSNGGSGCNDEWPAAFSQANNPAAGSQQIKLPSKILNESNLFPCFIACDVENFSTRTHVAHITDLLSVEKRHMRPLLHNFHSEYILF